MTPDMAKASFRCATKSIDRIKACIVVMGVNPFMTIEDLAKFFKVPRRSIIDLFFVEDKCSEKIWAIICGYDSQTPAASLFYITKLPPDRQDDWLDHPEILNPAKLGPEVIMRVRELKALKFKDKINQQ